jgi:hypothetical protein
MKGFDEHGFRFYTNFNSRKGKELVSDNKWHDHRSIGVAGSQSTGGHVFLLANNVEIGQ